MLGGHVAGLEVVEPCSSRSADVITLKVDPGGYAPVKASLTCSVSGWLTDARTSPVDAWIATRSAGCVSALRADSAACWIGGSMVVCTALPGWSETRLRMVTVLPDRSVTAAGRPGAPASWFST